MSRQFWINYYGSNAWIAYNSIKRAEDCSDSEREIIHVIEYSAYESLKSKLDKACEVLEFYSEMECPSDITFTNTPCEDNGKCAREALQDIRKKDEK